MRTAFTRHIRTVFVVVLMLLPLGLHATWEKFSSLKDSVASSPTQAYNGWCAYFFSEMRGLVGFTGSSLYGIWLTNDGGKSWKRASIPPGYANWITQISMTDSLRGWASLEGSDNLPSVWITTDGGNSWAPRGNGVNFSCIYETPAAVIVTSRNLSGFGQISYNKGQSFSSNVFPITNGVDFVDAQHGVITGFKDTPWQRTTDGGISWLTITPQIRGEAWSVFGDKTTGYFYAAGERDPLIRPNGGPYSDVLRSTNFGKDWQVIHTFPFYTNGHIFGAKGHLYVQIEETSQNPIQYRTAGLYRSDDGGFTWKSVGGPPHFNDKRFFVTGCNGGVVYAFDSRLNLWKTRDGGDGTIFEPNPDPVVSGLPITFNSRVCDALTQSVKISNQYCDDLLIIGADFLDPGAPVVTSGGITIMNSANFPTTIQSSSIDSIVFKWDPSKFSHRDTTVAIQVRLRFYSRALLTTRDTIITINAKAIGDPATALVTPPSLAFGQVSFCQPHDSLFTFTNTSCDTLGILSGMGSAPVRYQITDEFGNTIVYPIYLPPGASFKYKLSLYLDAAGSYSSTITFKLQHQGKQRDTTVVVSASVSPTGSFDVPIIIDMGKVSICSNLDSLLNLQNLGCRILQLSSASLKFGTDFTLPITNLPEDISPDSSSKLKIRLQPKSLGSLSDTLTLTFTTLDQPMTIKVVLRGEGTTGEAFFIIAPAVDTLFTLDMTRCDAPETFPITISNPGCNKLNLREVTITGAPIENVSRTVSATLPTDISNNQNVIATVRVSPTTLGSFSGTIYIRYQIEGDIERDTILFYSLSVRYGTRVLAIQPDNIDFGTFRLCTTLDTSVTLRNLGCDTLELISTTITANIDALSPLYMPRIKIPPGDTTSVRVRYAPIGAGSMTGNITFASTSDSTDPLTTTIQASIIPTDSVQIRLTPVRTPFYVGDTITMQLIPDNDVPQQVGLRSMAFGMNYNGDLLTVIEPIALIPGLAIIPGSSTRTLPAKLETQDYFLQGTPVIVMEKDKPFAEFRFIVRLTDTTTTPLFLSNIMLNNNDSVFAKCTLGVITAQTSAELTLLCGDSTLREFMRSGNVIGLRIAPSFPNPITSHTNYKATLPFTSSTKQGVRLVIVDALGNVVKTTIAEAMSGKNSLELDATTLASGTYHFAISSLSNSSEAVVGRFVVEH